MKNDNTLTVNSINDEKLENPAKFIHADETALLNIQAMIQSFPTTEPAYTYYEEKALNPGYCELEKLPSLCPNQKRIWALRSDLILAIGIKNHYVELGNTPIAEAVYDVHHISKDDPYGHTSLAFDTPDQRATVYYAGWVAQRRNKLQIVLWSGHYKLYHLTMFQRRLLECYIAKKFMDCLGRQEIIFQDCSYDDGQYKNFLKGHSIDRPKRIYTPSLIQEVMEYAKTSKQITATDLFKILNKSIMTTAKTNNKIKPLALNIVRDEEKSATDITLLTTNVEDLAKGEPLDLFLAKHKNHHNKRLIFYKVMIEIIAELNEWNYGQSELLHGNITAQNVLVETTDDGNFKVHLINGHFLRDFNDEVNILGIYDADLPFPPEFYVDREDQVIRCDQILEDYAAAFMIKKLWFDFFDSPLKDDANIKIKEAVLAVCSEQLLYHKRQNIFIVFIILCEERFNSLCHELNQLALWVHHIIQTKFRLSSSPLIFCENIFAIINLLNFTSPVVAEITSHLKFAGSALIRNSFLRKNISALEQAIANIKKYCREIFIDYQEIELPSIRLIRSFVVTGSIFMPIIEYMKNPSDKNSLAAFIAVLKNFINIMMNYFGREILQTDYDTQSILNICEKIIITHEELPHLIAFFQCFPDYFPALEIAVMRLKINYPKWVAFIDKQDHPISMTYVPPQENPKTLYMRIYCILETKLLQMKVIPNTYYFLQKILSAINWNGKDYEIITKLTILFTSSDLAITPDLTNHESYTSSFLLHPQGGKHSLVDALYPVLVDDYFVLLDYHAPLFSLTLKLGKYYYEQSTTEEKVVLSTQFEWELPNTITSPSIPENEHAMFKLNFLEIKDEEKPSKAVLNLLPLIPEHVGPLGKNLRRELEYNFFKNLCMVAHLFENGVNTIKIFIAACQTWLDSSKKTISLTNYNEASFFSSSQTPQRSSVPSGPRSPDHCLRFILKNNKSSLRRRKRSDLSQIQDLT